MILSPGDTIGILGGGQLGRMMAMAAARLGLDCHIYAPDAASPAFSVARHHTVGAYDDAAALAAFAASVKVITYEFENVPVASVEGLSTLVRPAPPALAVAQDRLAEKAFLADCGLPVARHRAVDSAADIADAIAELGAPAILKTRRMGYDGKGQARLTADTDPAAAFDAIGAAPAILEEMIPFTAETSTVLARAADDRTVAYDAPANHHADGILRRSVLPGPLDPTTEAAAAEMVAAVAARLDYVGVLAIEWFVSADPARPLIANEMAPRVHNTGHWTEDGAITSQFENHIRAVAGWPLGATTRLVDITMQNLIGADADDWARHLENPAARLHLYGKGAHRPGRKMGHVNFVGRPVDSSAKG
ncbi:5-(carboxyamino)imidazole ribonucleotide synthase [Acuticoccus mangrovi]|uniref:N5-carboxyaminoimidazole ribonucleotide synthase n=1 Tax=Acuticoccus mangrovi TaxID=2796142 RepID=A0A934IU39_9HYPH|nr:5-(carboxyamino)imidazole ribonucleotide synthase [Acuticoccus mangrovi]MBJ3778628.1 5-(carboxyamino)imidazole ribonucleotide synthase [Acuticoccus mangrovi]